MSDIIKITRGYDIRLKGMAEEIIEAAREAEKVALTPVDCTGVSSRNAVEPGDRVQVGTRLFFDRNDERVAGVSPVSGRVVDIIRGERRVIEAIVVAREGSQKSELTFSSRDLSSRERDRVLDILLKSGLFLQLKQRPFAVIPDPDDEPRDIFVSMFDSSPLAPRTSMLMQGNEDYFKRGLQVLSTLTKGSVHVGVDDRSQVPGELMDMEGIRLHTFRGPHPAGNVGVHVHHVSPVRGRNDRVWTCSLQGVIRIGKLFVTGKLDSTVTVAVTGPEAKNRKYYTTLPGSQICSFVESVKDPQTTRFISGNVLTGRNAGYDGYLGMHDSQVTLIAEPESYELLGWLKPGLFQESMSRTFFSRLLPKMRFSLDTNRNGSVRAFIPTGIYEKVLPMNIYPVFLMKSIIVQDIDEMEGLGIYELAEEDVAVCEFICPSKISWQKILREGIELIQKEG